MADTIRIKNSSQENKNYNGEQAQTNQKDNRGSWKWIAHLLRDGLALKV